MTILGDEMKKTRSPDYYGAQRIHQLETVNRALVEALYAAPEPVSNPSEEYINKWADWYYTTRRNALPRE